MSDTHAQTVRYVRDTMIDPSAPPVSETGVVKWMRENLFSGWLNTVLTLIALYVIYTVLAGVLPWLWNSVWNTGSLSECREALMVTIGGGSHDGACFAVISDRWTQLMFGFYPPELYWRPILAFILMFVALAPILFADKVPAKLMIFTAAYPFLATWLLWGGSFWLPLLVIGGFVVAVVAYRVVASIGGTFAVIAAVLAAVLWWFFAMPAINGGLHKLVASTRMEATLAEQQEVLVVTPDMIAAAEAAQAAQSDLIAELVATKDAFVATAEAARDAGQEPDDATIAGFEAVMEELYVEREIHQAYSREIFALQQQVSTANGLIASIEGLPTWEAELPAATAALKEMQDNLPSELKGLISPNQAPEGTSSADIAALQAALDAESSLAALKRNIDGAYERIGLVGLEPVTSREFGGFMLALIIGIAGIVISLPLGILLALGRQANLPIVKGFSVVFIEVIRGVPLIVWLFTASLLLNYFLPPGTNFDLVLRVVIMVTLFSAAYIAEVIRGGLAALPKGQYEAADALGLDYWKSMRLIILPQALKISIPGIVNTFIGLFKDTTLVGIIGLLDPLNLSNSIRASTDWNGVYYELFVFIGLLFFVSCYSMGRYSLWLEKKLQRGHR
ncbi:hypothetical protein BVC71_05900 [Marivivens niveibacter]|uniref:ABC transmembrane type-1 domain-containing protein n=1 Tax=Marivivens niveibacter TaxID=1930667 RepID=A0A251WYF4_9RHOB|nr:hypothetical protein BVC71_05900 [Marivivens niveibacter]